MAERQGRDRGAFESGLRRILEALRPYLKDVVLIGGWVPELYRKYGGFARWQGTTSFTTEADILLPGKVLPARARPELSELLREAELEPMAAVEGGAAIWRRPEGIGEEVEFIVQANCWAVPQPVSPANQE